MSDPAILRDLGVLAWIHEFAVQSASTLRNASLNTVNLEELIVLREKSAQFEQQVRSSFQANPRFVDQYFDRTDFAYDAALCNALVGSLETHLGSLTSDFTSIANRPISSNEASSEAIKQLLEIIHSLSHIARGLRNLASQSHLRMGLPKHSFLPSFLESPLPLIRQAIASETPKNIPLVQSLLGLSRAVLQLATNMSIQNTNHNIELIWAHILPKWIICLELDAHDQQLYGSLCAYIHTACINDPKRICDFITDSPEFYHFINYCKLLHDSTGDIDANMLHWFYLACKRFWPHLKLVLAELSRNIDGESITAVTPAQLFVLHVLDRELSDWVKDHPNTEASDFFGESFVLSVAECLVEQAERAEEVLVRIGLNCHLMPTEPPTPTERPFVDLAWAALQTIANMSMALGSALKSQPQSIRLIHTIIRFLGRSNSKAPSSEAEIKASRQPVPGDAVLGLKTLLVRILANYAFGCRVMQDEIRTAEGIPLLLNACKDDPFNPFVREWGLFACRNICEQNDENQQLIANLKASGVMPSVELEEMGFRAVLEETGKVRLEKLDEDLAAPKPPM